MKGSYSGHHVTVYGTIVPNLFPLLRSLEEPFSIKAIQTDNGSTFLKYFYVENSHHFWF